MIMQTNYENSLIQLMPCKNMTFILFLSVFLRIILNSSELFKIEFNFRVANKPDA